MTASEKLRALADEAERYTNGVDYVWPAVMDALPLIADVVAAAEQAEVCSMGCEACRNEDLIPALTALRDALESDE